MQENLCKTPIERLNPKNVGFPTFQAHYREFQKIASSLCDISSKNVFDALRDGDKRQLIKCRLGEKIDPVYFDIELNSQKNIIINVKIF